ncbi:MAG: helix-turn-helix domain-containing protein [Clostridia bacterium]|nr:helix-turn-helix domain-containing protein [Clostridia bacterium]
MPQNWLPGDIRDRIRDLCRANNLKQSELAHAIGIDKSTLSRFMSGKTDKLSDTSLQKIAQRLNVSTDFLLGNTDISDRKHYDIGELGLTVQAARNLYTHKVDPAIVCELLEHPRFGELTRLLSSYKDELFASGIAAQNQMLSSLGGLVLTQGKAHKDDMYAAYDTAHMLQAQRQPLHVSELDTIQQTFLQIVRDIKKDGPDNAHQATALTKESMQQMTETLTKGQDGIDLHQLSPEQIVGGIMGTMAMMEVPEAYNEQMTAAHGQIQTGLLQYFSILNQVKDNEGNQQDQRSTVPCLSGGRPASG